ncbi:XRE family transcriptional regulator [Roseomonas nepalensis]|uniref:XRE family transcriptional regulator n=1 Tax=Muricoccus nepalensis TaxID=1854500 RepID=A0A502FST6_9PROT|nr:XRE family transcriptional regulator [Roseomonas nepalensis]
MPQLVPTTCRAARALLDWPQSRLASAAGVGISTVKGFESGNKAPMRNNIVAMMCALEEAGVEFIPENGRGAGVRLRKPSTNNQV